MIVPIILRQTASQARFISMLDFRQIDSERGINTKASCTDFSSRQCKHVIFFFFKLPFWKSFLAICKANVAKATIVSACFH